MPIGTPIALHAHRTHISQQHNGELPDRAVESSRSDLGPNNRIGLAQYVQAITRHSPDNADRKTRPGERVTRDHRGRQTQLGTYRADFVLEQGPQRLNEGELEVIRKATDVVVTLDAGGASAAA